MSDSIGNGPKNTFTAQLVITGDDDINANFEVVNNVNFSSLTFDLNDDSLLTFNETSGEFELKRSGRLEIIATLNIDTSTGNSNISVCPEINTGAGWVFLNARHAELPVIGQRQTVMSGFLPFRINKGCKLRFQMSSSDGAADFKTEALPNFAIIPAAIVDFVLFMS